MFKNNNWHQICSQIQTSIQEALGDPWLALAVSPIDADQIFYGYTKVKCIPNASSILPLANYVSDYSDDGGIHVDIQVLVFQPNSTNPKLFCGNHGGISVKSEINITSFGGWEYRNNGLDNATIWSFDVSSEKEDVYIAGKQDNGVDVSRKNSTGTFSWEQIAPGGDGYGAQIGNDLTNQMFYKFNSYFRCYDYNNNLSHYNTDIGEPATFQIENYPDENHTMIFGGWELTSRTNGYSIGNYSTRLESDMGLGSLQYPHVTEFKFAPSDPNYIYVITAGSYNYINNPNDYGSKMYKSTTGLTAQAYYYPSKFTQMTLPTTTEYSSTPYTPVITGLAVSPTDKNKIWITFCGFEKAFNNNFKVYGSNNGGATWYNCDPLGSLNGIPVNGIVYQEGSDDRLFIATDCGVYTIDNTHVKWERYGDIPHVRATEIRINNLTNTLEVATFGRGIWQAPLPCIEINTAPLEITSNTLWDRSKVLFSDVIVKNNSTLTITTKVNLPPEAKIIVEPGSKLILSGGTLSCSCKDGMWKGIEVWCNKNLSQIPNSNQGYVYINGGTIENAREAVMLWHPDDWNSMGGIIEAYGSKFLNNTRSVAFMMYQNTFNGHPFRNLSSFKNCTFNINDDYRVPIINDFGTHVTLWAVNGVTFTGCNFLNEQTHKAYDMTQNQAIYSMDAGYNIGSSCDATNIYNGSCPPESLKRSYFKGFNTAVHAYGSSSGNVVKIDEAVFEDNVRGVEFDAFNYSWVNRSKFSIGNISIEGSPDYQEGIFTNTSWGFRIEENLLHSSLNSTFMTIGIRILNSENTDNLIYKDTLKGLYIANRAEGRNRGGNINGLQILCNDQSYNNTDISVVPLASFDQGIRLNQGDNNTSTAAGNLFSHLTMDIDNSLLCSPIKYFYTNTYAQNPTLITANVYTAIANNTNTCPSYINNGHNSPLATGTKITLTDEYDEKETIYLNLLYNYNNLIDGGNTNLLLNKIEMSWPEDAWDLRSELISKSPYLSEETLKKAAVKGVLPQAMLLEICLANPDATKAINFINFLVDSIPNPLPGYMIGLIKVNWEANTVRTLLEGNLANVSSRMALISNLMISDCMLDSVIQKQEVRNWLNRRGGINDYYSLTESYIEDNNYELATEYLEQIPILFSLNKDDNAEYDNFVEFLNFRSRISGREKTIMQLDSLEIETLQEIADNNTGRSSVMAQNILCFGYKRCKDYLVVESEEEKHLISNFSSKEAASNYNKIKVTPNPASVYVAFSWEFPLLKGSALLIINDNSGKSIEQKTISTKNGQWIWDTREINNGVYYYQVKSDGQDFCAGKVIVSK